MKFKVGDKVRVIEDNIGGTENGKIGVLSKIDNDTPRYRVDGIWCFKIELVSKGEVAKVQFVVIYDEEDGDPNEEFYSRKELMTWLKEAQDNEEIIWESIRIYHIDKVMKPKANIKISLKNI